MRAKNIRIPPELVYQSVGFVCEHFGENTRAKKSFRGECEARILYSVRQGINKL